VSVFPILAVWAVAASIIVLVGAVGSLAIAPRRLVLGPEVPAAGLVGVLVLAYAPSRFGSAWFSLAAIGLGVLMLGAIAYTRRRRLGIAGQPLPRLSRGLVAVVVTGSAASLVALLPTLTAGAATTIAWTNWDAWWYAGMVDWLREHPARLAGPTPLDPVSFPAWDTEYLNLPIGIASFMAVVALATGRLGLEVVGPSLAIMTMVGTSAWVSLAASLGVRGPGWRTASVGALASLSPMVLATSVQIYANQFVSLALWPFAVALIGLALRRPAPARCIAAGVALAAIMSLYMAMLLWIAFGALVFAVGIVVADRRVYGWVMACRRASWGLLGIAAVAVIAAPLQSMLVWRNLDVLAGKPSNLGFPALSGRTITETGLGSWFASENTTGWLSALAAAAIITVLVGAIFLAATRSAGWLWIMALLAAAAPGAVSGTVYMTLDPYPYGAYKAVITSGALVMGVALMSLSAERERARRLLSTVAIGTALVAWLPQSLGLLRATMAETATGFSSADVRAIRFLGSVPNGSTVLVEGAVSSPTAFRARMTLSYGSSAVATSRVIGLGTTASYFATGGEAAWRPRQPWDYVMTYDQNGPSPRRHPLMTSGAYSLFPAPPIDVTPWGSGWRESGDGRGRGVFADTAVLLISNRTARWKKPRVAVRVTATGRPQRITLQGPGTLKSVAINRGEEGVFMVRPSLRPRSVASMRLSARSVSPSVGRPSQGTAIVSVTIVPA
jgi:hypothetical protein